MKAFEGAAGSPAVAAFSDEQLGLRLTLGRTEMFFSNATAGDFGGPSEVAVEALEALSGIARDHWAQDEQTHGTRVNVVRPGEENAPFTRPADAQVSDRADLLCAVRTADCLAVLITGTKAFGAVHAGWRGLQDGVIAAAVAEISKLDPGPLRAAIGPGARGCCYEVGDEIIDVFARYPSAFRSERKLDLATVAREQLLAAGVSKVGEASA